MQVLLHAVTGEMNQAVSKFPFTAVVTGGSLKEDSCLLVRLAPHNHLVSLSIWLGTLADLRDDVGNLQQQQAGSIAESPACWAVVRSIV